MGASLVKTEKMGSHSHRYLSRFIFCDTLGRDLSQLSDSLFANVAFDEDFVVVVGARTALKLALLDLAKLEVGLHWDVGWNGVKAVDRGLFGVLLAIWCHFYQLKAGSLLGSQHSLFDFAALGEDQLGHGLLHGQLVLNRFEQKIWHCVWGGRGSGGKGTKDLSFLNGHGFTVR